MSKRRHQWELGGKRGLDRWRVTHCYSTISNNSAEPAGGISNYAPGQLEISNTILNAGASGVNIVNGGTITSDGYNLSSDRAAAVI